MKWNNPCIISCVCLDELSRKIVTIGPRANFSRFFDEIYMVALKKFLGIMGLDPPYVAVFPDPSVAAS